MQSLGRITDATVIYQNRRRDISNPITEPIGESLVALEDGQKFVIENREYSSELSSGDIQQAK